MQEVQLMLPHMNQARNCAAISLHLQRRGNEEEKEGGTNFAKCFLRDDLLATEEDSNDSSGSLLLGLFVLYALECREWPSRGLLSKHAVILHSSTTNIRAAPYVRQTGKKKKKKLDLVGISKTTDDLSLCVSRFSCSSRSSRGSCVHQKVSYFLLKITPSTGGGR